MGDFSSVDGNISSSEGKAKAIDSFLHGDISAEESYDLFYLMEPDSVPWKAGVFVVLFFLLRYIYMKYNSQ
jgi:hypothetical protein